MQGRKQKQTLRFIDKTNFSLVKAEFPWPVLEILTIEAMLIKESNYKIWFLKEAVNNQYLVITPAIPSPPQNVGWIPDKEESTLSSTELPTQEALHKRPTQPALPCTSTVSHKAVTGNQK